MSADWEPTPPRAGSVDDAMERGFDWSSLISDRYPGPPLDDEWQAAFDASVRAATHLRYEDGDDLCGTRCDRCDERMCAIDGPEPRACATTCCDCQCSCTTCLHVAQDLRAELVAQIARES